MTPPVPVSWRLREPPLSPSGVAAMGGAARALAQRLLQRSDAELLGLRGVAAPDLLLLLGEAGDLPWADGATYLGRDPEAPSLWVPTWLAPDLHPALIERALAGRAATSGAPMAVLVEPRRLVPLSQARPVVRAALSAWLERAA